MKYEEYAELRRTLIDEAQALIDGGELEQSEAKMAEVRDLDTKFDDECRSAANLRALEGEARKTDPSAPGTAPKAGTGENTREGGAELTAENAVGSHAYATAWAKRLMNKALTAAEEKVCAMVDEYVHTTSNTGEVIPTEISQGIWDEVADLYPYWNEVSKTYVNGNLTLIQASTSTDAAWYEDGTDTSDGTETFTTLTLDGKELSRAITVSWKLKEMAVEDFIPYITRKMAEKMGAALDYGVLQGIGTQASGSESASEPLGVITALEAESGAPQVVTYTAGSLEYADLTAARALVKSGYGVGLKIYANAATIWTEIANVVDTNNRPIFIADPTSGGVGRVLGCVVEEDAGVPDGGILFSNAARGYAANVNKDMTMVTEDHAKARTTDYVGYAIVDGAPTTTKAHAYLEYASEA